MYEINPQWLETPVEFDILVKSKMKNTASSDGIIIS
jgi:hypothetical protein